MKSVACYVMTDNSCDEEVVHLGGACVSVVFLDGRTSAILREGVKCVCLCSYKYLHKSAQPMCKRAVTQIPSKAPCGGFGHHGSVI